MKKKVIITRNILPDGLSLLEAEGFELDLNLSQRPMAYEELLEKSRNADAIISMLSDKIDQHFLESNPQLKVIANYAVGFNNIDLETARRLNIRISNTPDVLTEATAETALGLMIAAGRNFLGANASVHDGRWKNWGPRDHLGFALKGKTLGVIGLGRIGHRLAEMASHAFKMQIIYTANSLKENSIGARLVSMDELLSQSDYISIHAPLNATTKYLIGKDQFQRMRAHCVLVNTARGELINQDALIWALKENKIAAAGLDVTDPEPLPLSSELLELENAFILPHIGSATFEARRAMAILCAKNIIAGLNNKELISEVK